MAAVTFLDLDENGALSDLSQIETRMNAFRDEGSQRTMIDDTLNCAIATINAISQQINDGVAVVGSAIQQASLLKNDVDLMSVSPARDLLQTLSSWRDSMRFSTGNRSWIATSDNVALTCLRFWLGFRCCISFVTLVLVVSANFFSGDSPPSGFWRCS
jgi:hypothetical protein